MGANPCKRNLSEFGEAQEHKTFANLLQKFFSCNMRRKNAEVDHSLEFLTSPSATPMNLGKIKNIFSNLIYFCFSQSSSTLFHV